MSTRTRLTRSVFAALSALIVSACGASATSSDSTAKGHTRNPDHLVFATIPTENSATLKQSFTGVIAMLEKETGKKITYQNATDYAAIIEGQRVGKIDIAVYGPFTYVLARNSGLKIQPAAAFVTAKGAQPGYRSYGFVKTGSPIKTLADAKGKKVCFVEPNSTSGYLYPSAGLLQAKIDPKKDIKPIMAGGHDASILAVVSGQCDLGFAYDAMVDHQLIDKGQIKKGAVTTIWKSEIIPGSPAAVSSDLDPALQAKIVNAFRTKANIDYLKAHGFCKEVCAIGDQSNWGFAKVADSYYNGVRKVCDITKDKQCTG